MTLAEYKERAKKLSFEALAYTLQDVAMTLPLHPESTPYALKLADELEAYSAEYTARIRGVKNGA